MQYSINIIGENGEDFLWRGDAEDRSHAEGLAMDAFKEEFGDDIKSPQAHDVVHVVIRNRTWSMWRKSSAN